MASVAEIRDLDRPVDGATVIAEVGCGIFVLLVVNGPAAGQVWDDLRYESGLLPALDAEQQPMTFDAWWMRIMGEHLARFERVAAMMTAGAEHEAIHRELEPDVLQLHVDETLLSIMDIDPERNPFVRPQALGPSLRPRRGPLRRLARPRGRVRRVRRHGRAHRCRRHAVRLPYGEEGRRRTREAKRAAKRKP